MRGTTPNLTFKISLAADMIAKAKIAFKQGKVLLLAKHTNDLDIKDGEVSVTLTRAESLLFPDNSTVRVQLEVETTEGLALKTKACNVYCSELLSPEVLR
jgi:hypothetical protein